MTQISFSYKDFAIQSATDYYPFGMGMPGRSFSSSGYRFGFNGIEKDDEIKGTGNSYVFEYRMHDTRLGRFLSIDPLASDAPGWSPYRFGFCNPIIYTDPLGLFEDWYQSEAGNVIWKEGNDKSITTQNGETFKNIGTTYNLKSGNTTYSYDQNKVVGISTSTLNDNQFQTQFDSRFGNEEKQKVACKRACDVMLSNAGVTSSGRNDATQQVGKETGTTKNHSIEPTNNLQRGNQTLQNEVEAKGNPIIVGVDRGIHGRNMNDGTTDHWIVISGVNYNLRNNTTSYNYFDPGNRDATRGANSSNILSRSANGLFINANNRRTYTVTNIRQNR